jgi:protein tyrosine phosphatase (PTP) superfamily phosphohydrolase (DUF442 family)
MRRNRKTVINFLVISSVIFVFVYLEAFTLLYALYRIEFSNNFYEVESGVLYRSGEMRPADLGELIEKYRISSVLDLRISGETIQKDGVSEEQIVSSHGAKYVNFPIATTRVPAKEDLLRLDGILHSVRTPLLIHCSTGALRTGVVTTLWLQEVRGMATEQAQKQLSPYFGYSVVEYLYKEWANKHPPLPYLLYEYWHDQEAGDAVKSFHSWLGAGETVPDEGGKLTFQPKSAQKRRGVAAKCAPDNSGYDPFSKCDTLLLLA